MLNTGAEAELSKKIAIRKIRQIIESRIVLNEEIASYFLTCPDKQFALKIYLSHFVKPEFHDAFAMIPSKVAIASAIEGCDTDTKRYKLFLTWCFSLKNQDAIVNELFTFAQSMAFIEKKTDADQFQLDAESKYFQEIMRIALTHLNRDLSRFYSTYKRSEIKSDSECLLTINLQKAIQDCRDKCSKLRSSSSSGVLAQIEHQLMKISTTTAQPHYVSPIFFEKKNVLPDFSPEKLSMTKALYEVYDCYQLLLAEEHLIVRSAEISVSAPSPMVETVSAQNIANEMPKLQQISLSIAQKPEVVETISVESVADEMPKLQQIPSSIALEPENVSVEALAAIEQNKEKNESPTLTVTNAIVLGAPSKTSSVQPLYTSKRKMQRQEELEKIKIQKEDKKSNKKSNSQEKQNPGTPEQNAKILRLNFYREKLAHFKDLIENIFRENVPHLEIRWSEVERMMNAIGAKITEAEGSRITLIFQENTVHEKWATILGPTNVSQRGIHKSHIPGKSDDRIAGIYVEILRKALVRFKLTPQELWPECEVAAGLKILRI